MLEVKFGHKVGDNVVCQRIQQAADDHLVVWIKLLGGKHGCKAVQISVCVANDNIHIKTSIVSCSFCCQGWIIDLLWKYEEYNIKYTNDTLVINQPVDYKRFLTLKKDMEKLGLENLIVDI